MKIDLSDEATLLFTGILNAINATIDLTEKTNELLQELKNGMASQLELMQKNYDLTEDYIERLNLMMGGGKK